MSLPRLPLGVTLLLLLFILCTIGILFFLGGPP